MRLDTIDLWGYRNADGRREDFATCFYAFGLIDMKFRVFLLGLAITQSALAGESSALIQTGASQNSVGTFGVQLGNSNLGGQTFYLSEDSAVDGFSLFVRYGYVYARGYLAQWDGETLGQVLYESAPAFVYSGNFSTKPTEFRFDFSPISLEAGVEYIAFMRVLGQVNGASFPAARTFLSLAETQIAGRPIRGYAGYGLSSTQVDGVHLAEAVWDLSGEMDHALMIRGVSAVPELSPLLMLVGGVMTLGIAMRRRAR